MREITLGQYYPVRSVIHSLDPRAKLVLMIAYIVMIFFIDTFVGYGLVLLFLTLLHSHPSEKERRKQYV